MLTADVRDWVHGACQRDENVFGPAFFDQHLVVVAECAARLGGALGADLEVLELAAYLHDISAVLDVNTMLDHPRLSADCATGLLLARGYPEDRVSMVARAIASHSDPLPMGSASPEAISISNADAVARILRPAYWMYFAFVVRKLSFEEGRQWLRRLLEKQWSALIEPATELVATEYAATLDLLTK